MRNGSFCFFLLIFLASSCSLRPYRATIGFSSSSSEFKTIDGDGDERRLCIESTAPNATEDDKCAGAGFKRDVGLAYIDPWLEFTPSYFGKTSAGWTSFISYTKAETKLLDYPVEGDKTDIEVERFSLNPIVFYNFGDKYLKGGRGMSFRIGLGAALNYVTNFKLRRESTGESFYPDAPFKPAWSSFVEFSWNWFIFRVEHSQIEYGGKKFNDVAEDDLKVETNKVSLLYAYYF